MSLDQPNLELQIPAFDVAEVAETVSKHLDQAAHRGAAVNQERHPIHLSRRLRPDGERDGEDTAAREGDERSSVKHRMTG